MNRRTHRSFVVTIALSFVFFLIDDAATTEKSGAFDRGLWATSGAWCAHSPREAMVRDVMTNHLHEGMTMHHVRSLLGQADQENGDGTWIYDVGYESDGLMRTCVSLELFSTSDRLDRWELARDD